MGVRTWATPLAIATVMVGGCTDDKTATDSDAVTALAPHTTTASSPSITRLRDTPSGQPLFHDPLDDDRNGWGVADDPDYGSTAFDGGDYVWTFKGSNAHRLPEVLGERYDRGELDMADVVVHAEGTIVAGGGVIGVFCRDTPDTDADWQWYEFVVRDGFAAIRKTDSEANMETLARTDDLTVSEGQPAAI